MRAVIVLLLTEYKALKLSTTSKLQLSLPFSLDSAEAQKVPSNENYINRYCDADPGATPRLASTVSLMEYGGPEDVGSFSREHMLYGKCEEDTDCASQSSSRPYCVDNICRECREGYEFEDCGPSGSFCNAENGYTCSTCTKDEECPSMSYCRTSYGASSTIVSGKMPRKSCLKCETVPDVGEIIDEGTCAWRCPIEQYYLPPASPGEKPSCLDCPSCSAGQFYAPRLTPKTQFFSVCTNATDVICNECSSIGVDDSKPEMCAKILSPSMRLLDDNSVGDLGSQFPCRFFKCKEGWFLEGMRSKCKKCHLTMCPSGEFLAGCGNVDPGACKPCKGRLPKGAYFIDPTDPQYTIVNPEDTCQFKCSEDETIFDHETNACVACDSSANADDENACHRGKKQVYRLTPAE
jgi:hypothetical protein